MARTNQRQVSFFVKDLAKFGEHVDEQALEAHKRIAFRGFGGVTEKTRVDTGRARANWQVAINSPEVPNLEDTDVSTATGRARGVLASLSTPYQIIYISNSLPYVPTLENGVDYNRKRSSKEAYASKQAASDRLENLKRLNHFDEMTSGEQFYFLTVGTRLPMNGDGMVRRTLAELAIHKAI